MYSNELLNNSTIDFCLAFRFSCVPAVRLRTIFSFSLLCQPPKTDVHRVDEPSCVDPSCSCTNDFFLTLSVLLVLLISILSNSFTPHQGVTVPPTAETVKNQIGLLRGYFEHHLARLESLPDDPQRPAQAKLGPLGQVIRSSSAAIAAAAAAAGRGAGQ